MNRSSTSSSSTNMVDNIVINHEHDMPQWYNDIIESSWHYCDIYLEQKNDKIYSCVTITCTIVTGMNWNLNSIQFLKIRFVCFLIHLGMVNSLKSNPIELRVRIECFTSSKSQHCDLMKLAEGWGRGGGLNWFPLSLVNFESNGPPYPCPPQILLST